MKRKKLVFSFALLIFGIYFLVQRNSRENQTIDQFKGYGVPSNTEILLKSESQFFNLLPSLEGFFTENNIFQKEGFLGVTEEGKHFSYFQSIPLAQEYQNFISTSEICTQSCKNLYKLSNLSIIVPIEEQFQTESISEVDLRIDYSGFINLAHPISENFGLDIKKVNSVDASLEYQEERIKLLNFPISKSCKDSKFFELSFQSESDYSIFLDKCGVLTLKEFLETSFENRESFYYGINILDLRSFFENVKNLNISSENNVWNIEFSFSEISGSEKRVTFFLLQNFLEVKDVVIEKLPDGTFYERSILHFDDFCMENLCLVSEGENDILFSFSNLNFSFFDLENYPIFGNSFSLSFWYNNEKVNGKILLG